MVKRSVTSVLVIAASACEAGDDEYLPPIQIEGEFLSYATAGEVCPGTVTQAELWMLEVAEQLGIPRDSILPIIYYQLDREAIAERCWSGTACAEHHGDKIVIIAAGLLEKHELVHALHLSAWPTRQALLHEGLATLFDDGLPHRFPLNPSAQEMAALIEVDHALDDMDVYAVGAYLMYWITSRHGTESLAEFWNATDPKASADDFLVGFAEHFNESLNAMLTEVVGEPACQIVTCVGTAQPWVDGVWTTELPQGCDDDQVMGLAGDSGFYFEHDLVEIEQPGVYEFAVSAGQGSIAGCGSTCSVGSGSFATVIMPAGESIELSLQPGLYRVEALSLGNTSGQARLQQVQ